MRRRFLRKRATLLLCAVPLLLTGGMTAFKLFERERDIFIRDKHSFVEKQLGEASGLKVSLGKLGIGIFQDTVLENLSFALPDGTPFVRLSQARFRREEDAVKIKFEKGDLSWKGIVLKDLEGRIRLEGLNRSLGPTAFLKKVEMEGEFQNGGRLKIFVEKRNPAVLKGEVFLQNFRWGERRLTGIGRIFFFIRDRMHPWKGVTVKVVWESLLLNGEPLESVFGRLSVVGETLSIEGLRWGEMATFSGKVGLSSPYPTEGRLHFQKIGHDVIKHFLKKEGLSIPPQSLEGQVFLNGPLRKIHLRGHLVAHRGRVKEIDYQNFISTFYGHWPVVTVESRIERELPKESSLTVRGLVDLGELGKKGFYKTTALEGADAMVWKGIVFQHPSQETVVLGKENQTTSVSMKSYLNQTLPQEKEEEEFELEYRLRSDKTFKMRFKGDEEFLGLEKKTTF